MAVKYWEIIADDLKNPVGVWTGFGPPRSNEDGRGFRFDIARRH
jgi:hypothetical protein